MEARSLRAGFWATIQMSDDSQHNESEEIEQVTPQEEGTVKSSFQQLHTVTPFSKYLAMVLFILLPFVGGWIGYQYGYENKVTEFEPIVSVNEVEQVNESVTPEWKTYRNEEYGFEFQYPENWTVDEFEDGLLIYTKEDWDNLNQDSSFIVPELTITLSDKKDFKSLHQFSEDNLNSWFTGYREVSHGKSNNLEYIHYSDRNSTIASNPPDVILTALNEHYLVITAGFSVSEYRLTRIIESFKIIDETDLKTYHNEEFGFEINLPKFVTDYWTEENENGNISFFVDIPNSDTNLDVFRAFVIVLFLKGEWDSLNLEIDERGYICSTVYKQPCEGAYLGENSQYIFAVTNGHYCPKTGIGCELQEFSQKLPTNGNFRVLEPSQSTWETYRNEEYGFEFQYPGSWTYEEWEGESFFYTKKAWAKIESGSVNTPSSLNISIYEKSDDSNGLLEFSRELNDGWFTYYTSSSSGYTNGLEYIHYTQRGSEIDRHPYDAIFVNFGNYYLLMTAEFNVLEEEIEIIKSSIKI